MMKSLYRIIQKDYKRLNWPISKALISAEFNAVLSFRLYQYIYKNVSKNFGFYLYNRSKKKYNVDINPNAHIDEGFVIVHIGGIVIGGGCQIEKNCSIQSCVTLGEKEPSGGMPHIGTNCYLGTGAKILGNIVLGNDIVVGANSVVVHSFRENNLKLAGIPAKILA